MELWTLDSSLQPSGLVENYSSLVWTERYDTPGDFELVSYEVEKTLAALPRESFVTLRESTVPMVVETHSITKDPKSAPKITVTGRSFETVLDRRGSTNVLPAATARPFWSITAASPSDAAYKAMRVVIGDTARTRTDNSQPLASEVALGALVLPAIAPAISALDAIPEVTLPLPKDYSTLTPNTYEIEAGNLYEVVMNLLKLNHHGLKATRPQPGSTKASIEVYNGADIRSLVVFDARFDQFDSSTYLLSAQGSLNVAYVYGPNGSDKVLRNVVDGSHPEPSGLNRRVVAIDESSDDTLTTSMIRNTRGIIEIYKFNPTALFDGEISVQVAAGYNVNYFLGDILLLVGEYGLSSPVRVLEFIRSSDANGEKAYPAFEIVS